MEISPEPKDSNDNLLELPRDKCLELLKVIMGEDGLTFLNLDNAITAVRQGHRVWQAPFAIGLWALPLLYHWETDSQGKLIGVLYRFPRDIDSQDKGVLLKSVLMVFGLSSQTYSKSKDMAVSDLVGSALEPLEARYDSLSAEVSGYGLTDEDAHMLFHTRLALGVLLLVKGDEARGTTILRQMAATKTTRRGPTISVGMGLDHLDVEVTKELAAMILQDFYAKRQDYESALYLLTEAVASSGPGPFSESLLAVVPVLLESFALKCERVNSSGEWVKIFDRAASITEMCGEADVSGNLPSDCKVTSPQFLAWKFGQLVARFIIRNRSGYQDYGTMVDSILREGGYGSDWGTGTGVASLLCEYDEHRNWQILRQQYLSVWESSSRYQWLNLCQAGTETDLYWAMRIGFANQMLSTIEQTAAIPVQTETPYIVRDIEMTKDIATTIALRQIKEQQDLDKYHESLRNMLEERLPPGKREVRHELQRRLSSVWSKLPAKVVDTLVKAENYYRTVVNTDDAKVWFNKAVEASLNCCLVEPLVSFMQKRGDKRIAVCFPPPRGVERKTSSELRKLPLWEWSNVFETLSVPVHQNLASLGGEDFKRFMKERFGELPLPALTELSRSLRDFCQRKDSAHFHPSRYEEEIQELEQMRELVLGMKRPSVITQIFQLFGIAK